MKSYPNLVAYIFCLMLDWDVVLSDVLSDLKKILWLTFFKWKTFEKIQLVLYTIFTQQSLQ